MRTWIENVYVLNMQFEEASLLGLTDKHLVIRYFFEFSVKELKFISVIIKKCLPRNMNQ